MTDKVQPLSSRPLTPRSATLLAHAPVVAPVAAPVVVPVVVPVVPQVESTITNDYYGSILPNQIVLPVQEKGRQPQQQPQQQQPPQQQQQTSLTATDTEQRYWTYVEVGVEEGLLAPMEVRWLENAMKKINDDIRIINNDRTYGLHRQKTEGRSMLGVVLILFFFPLNSYDSKLSFSHLQFFY